MNGLYERLSTWGHGAIDGREAIRVVKQIWDIGEEEGYTSGRGRLAADVVLVAAAHAEYVPELFVESGEMSLNTCTVQKQPWIGLGCHYDGHPTSWALTAILPKRCE
jgi:hypothetical protein